MLGFFRRRRPAGERHDVEKGPTGLLFGLALILIVGGFVVSKALFSPSAGSIRASERQAKLEAAELPTPDLFAVSPTPWIVREVITETVQIVVTATPSPTPIPTATPWIIREMLTVPVTVTVAGPPVVKWRERIVEKRVPITVTVPLPAPSPVPLSGSMIELCWRVEGVKEVWIDGDGVGGSGCRVYPAVVGENLRGIRVMR